MFKHDLIDFSFGELQNFCKDKNLPKFRASQIWRWMYCFGFKSFNEITLQNVLKSFGEITFQNVLKSSVKLHFTTYLNPSVKLRFKMY